MEYEIIFVITTIVTSFSTVGLTLYINVDYGVWKYIFLL